MRSGRPTDDYYCVHVRVLFLYFQFGNKTMMMRTRDALFARPYLSVHRPRKRRPTDDGFPLRPTTRPKKGFACAGRRLYHLVNPVLNFFFFFSKNASATVALTPRAKR